MAAGTQLDKTNPANAGADNVPVGTLPGQQALEHINGLWSRGTTGWAELAPLQRTWVTVGAVLILATIAGLIWYSTRVDWRTLYAGLDPEDSRQMAQILTQAQIPFDLSANGTALKVPVGQLDKARLATAAKGGPRSGRMGFELFDKPNWVGSEFD